MSKQIQGSFEENLKGYKEKINPLSKATLRWDKELIFVGRTQEGYEIEFDAHVQWGCKPTDALLLALAGCMGIDYSDVSAEDEDGFREFQDGYQRRKEHNTPSIL